MVWPQILTPALRKAKQTGLEFLHKASNISQRLDDPFIRERGLRIRINTSIAARGSANRAAASVPGVTHSSIFIHMYEHCFHAFHHQTHLHHSRPVHLIKLQAERIHPHRHLHHLSPPSSSSSLPQVSFGDVSKVLGQGFPRRASYSPLYDRLCPVELHVIPLTELFQHLVALRYPVLVVSSCARIVLDKTAVVAHFHLLGSEPLGAAIFGAAHKATKGRLAVAPAAFFCI